MDGVRPAVLDDDDVARYLARIRLDGSDLALTSLQRAHVETIPDENLDVLLGREIRLDLPALVAKLVGARRGGYCYVAPEDDEVWQMSLFDMVMYTFSEDPHHPVDDVTPNHFSSTRPQSIFTQVRMVQRWVEGDVQVGLVGRTLTERLPDGRTVETRVEPSTLGSLLRDRFGLSLDPADVAALVAADAARSEADGEHP